VKAKPGKFELADGGTLLLDEIAEMDVQLQAKLLRALQEKEVERVGSTHPLRTDVRVVATTNQRISDAIAKGTFREDLYFRLNVFEIALPPLRERREDILLLADHLAASFSPRRPKRISPEAQAVLAGYGWPGNVRELRNVIEHGAILTRGDTLRVPLLEETAPVAAPEPTLAESEKELILQALEMRGWRIKGQKGAAAALALNPSTLYSRMKKLGIRPPERQDPGRRNGGSPGGRRIDSQT
jgi:DNA-binding NtrC family response regulator